MLSTASAESICNSITLHKNAQKGSGELANEVETQVQTLVAGSLSSILRKASTIAAARNDPGTTSSPLDDVVQRLVASSCNRIVFHPVLVNPTQQAGNNTKTASASTSSSLKEMPTTTPNVKRSLTRTQDNAVSSTTTSILAPEKSDPVSSVIPTAGPIADTTTQPSSGDATSQPPHTTTAQSPSPSPTSSPQEPSTPPPRRVVVKTTQLLFDDEAESTVVVSTAGSASMVTASFGSGVGSIVSANAAVKLASCGLASEEDESPEFFELPLSFGIGSSGYRDFVGGIVAHTLLNCAVFAVSCGLEYHHLEASPRPVVRRSTTVKVFSMIFTGLYSFFTPNILAACSTVLFHAGGGATEVGVVGVASALLFSVFALVSVSIYRSISNGVEVASQSTTSSAQEEDASSEEELEQIDQQDEEDDDSPKTIASSSAVSTEEKTVFTIVAKRTFVYKSSTKSTSTSSSSDSDEDEQYEQQERTAITSPLSFFMSGRVTLDMFLPLFEGCRNFHNPVHRNYAAVEVFLSSLISMVAGARPEGHCQSAAYAVCVIAAVGLLYAAGVRPYRTYLDTVFSVAAYAAQLMLCVAVVSITRKNNESGDAGSSEDGWESTVLTASLWMISWCAYLQLVSQLVWSWIVRLRRNAQQQQNIEESSVDHEHDRGRLRRKDYAKRRRPQGDTTSTSEPLLVLTDLEETAFDNSSDEPNAKTNNPLLSSKTPTASGMR